jgi:hypothetical protein
VQKMFCSRALTDCGFKERVSGLRTVPTRQSKCLLPLWSQGARRHRARSKLMRESRNEWLWNGRLWLQSGRSHGVRLMLALG